MRTRHVIHLLLVVTLASGSGCAALKSCFTRRTPAQDPNQIIQPEIVDADSGELLMPLGGAFDETRERELGVSFEPVYFGFDSAQLARIEVAKIERVATYLLQNSRHVLVVEGHCDERGSNEYNLSLGEQRANSIRTYLVNLGVSGDRVQTRSFGEEKPAVSGSNEAAWRLNRRGEFAVYR